MNKQELSIAITELKEKISRLRAETGDKWNDIVFEILIGVAVEEIEESEHRAKVAERALKIAEEQITDEWWGKDFTEEHINEAIKELEEEEKKNVDI